MEIKKYYFKIKNIIQKYEISVISSSKGTVFQDKINK